LARPQANHVRERLVDLMGRLSSLRHNQHAPWVARGSDPHKVGERGHAQTTGDPLDFLDGMGR